MQLPDEIVERLGRLTCLHPASRVQFRLPDASDFYVQVPRESGAGPAVALFGQVENPTLTLEMSNSTLDAILDGRLSARHAFLLGDIHYTGDREVAAALADLFPVT